MALSQQAKIREETPRSVSRRAGGVLPTPHAEQACGRDYDPYSERGHARTQQNFIEKSAHYSPCSPLRRKCRTYPCRSDIAPQRPDCVAGHVRLEVRRETGKE